MGVDQLNDSNATHRMRPPTCVKEVLPHALLQARASERRTQEGGRRGNAGRRTTQKSQGNATKQQTKQTHRGETQNEGTRLHKGVPTASLASKWLFVELLGPSARERTQRDRKQDSQRRKKERTEKRPEKRAQSRKFRKGVFKSADSETPDCLLRNWKFRHVLLAYSSRAPYVVLSVKQA